MRLNYSEWFDNYSLMTRIMVAAGGGGAEWARAIGGNGGALIGGSSLSTIYNSSYYKEPCNGATQTSGTICPRRIFSNYNVSSYPGTFGSSGNVTENVQSNDYGGFGGGGYYGGTSYDYSFAGSGGSSFISGHPGCNSIRSKLPINHTDTPFHYSGYVFTDTVMIEGNKTMPLPYCCKKEGIYNSSRGGAFRITLLSYEQKTCNCKKVQHDSTMLIYS